MSGEQAVACLDVMACAADPARRDAYEDSFALDCLRGILVIADGAGTSYDPKGWADALCRAALSIATLGTPPEIHAAWLAALNEWRSRPDLPQWDAGLEPKASAATLGILVVRPPSWSFVCVGDVNILHFGSDGTRRTLPNLYRSEDYGTTPQLIRDTSSKFSATMTAGQCTVGDSLYIFTDGIGPWLVDNASGDVAADLAEMHTADFEVFLERLRSNSSLKADDATLGRCLIRPAQRFGTKEFLPNGP